jgi:hypothetical protein
MPPACVLAGGPAFSTEGASSLSERVFGHCFSGLAYLRVIGESGPKRTRPMKETQMETIVVLVLIAILLKR